MVDSANNDGMTDIERDLVRVFSPSDFALDEKRTSPAPERKPAPKMLSLRHFIFTLLTISLVAFTLVSGLSPIRVPRSPTLEDQKKFQGIVDSTGTESFPSQDNLHKHLSNYKIDEYNEAKLAVAAGQQQNEESSGSLANLLKRQETGTTNGTVITPPDITTETTQTTTTATKTESFTSSTVTTESQPPIPPTIPPTVPTTTPSTSATTNTPPGETSQNVPPNPTTKDTSVPTASGPSKTPSLTPPPNTSSEEPRQSVTSVETLRSTSANGSVQTVVRTTVIQAGQPDQTSVGDASKTTAKIGLQTNKATKTGGGMGVIVAFMLALTMSVI